MSKTSIGGFIVFFAIYLFSSNAFSQQDGSMSLSSSERALKDFFVALELKDHKSILRQIMPNPDAKVLSEGKKPSIENLNMIYFKFNNIYTFKDVRVGETFRYGGRKITATKKMVNERRAIVGMYTKKKLISTWPIFYVKDAWRVDADAIIKNVLSKKGMKPTVIAEDYWKDVADLENILNHPPALWYLKNTQFINKFTSPFFHWLSDDKEGAYYPKDDKCPKLKMFGEKLVETSFNFNDGFLNRLEATFYEKDRSSESLDKKAFLEKLKTLSSKLDELVGEEGVKQEMPEKFRKSKKPVYTKAWVLNDTYTIYLKWAFSKSVVKKGKRKRTLFTPEYLQIISEEFDKTNDPRELNTGNKFVEVKKKAQNILKDLGVGITPYDKRFWEQNKVAFLGGFVDDYKVFWTTEQKKGSLEEFRSCYLRTIKPDAADRGGFKCFIKNKPLIDADVRLFSYSIVAMTASFFDGKLVKFTFDIWNKGDANINSEYTGAKQGEEKNAKSFMKKIIANFKKAGAKLKRVSSSKNNFTKVRDTRLAFQAGESVITFISKKKEYYSISIENVSFATYQKMEMANSKKERGRKLRNIVKKKIITVEKIDPEKRWRKEGDVYLDIPMVDQGAKGYCAPATVLRVIKYFGQNATLNEIASLMDTNAEGENGGGTRVDDVLKGVKKVSSKLKLRFKDLKLLSKKRLKKKKKLQEWIDDNVIENIDNGVPIYWCNQRHMRLIVGYNLKKRQVLMSDSWGRPGYDRYSYERTAIDTVKIFVTR